MKSAVIAQFIAVVRRGALCTPLLLLALSTVASAQDGEIEQLSWLAGSWMLTDENHTSEEHWLPAAGGIMLGVHRDTHPKEKTFFEFLRIESQEGSLVYVASPMGRGATMFSLTVLRQDFVRFENPSHDFPVRIEYELTGDTELTARISGKGGANPRSWIFKRTHAE